MSSSGPENRFIQSIHRLLPAGVYRMKNHNPYTSGIADCWYSGDAGDLWVEYKHLTLPKRSSTIVSLIDGKNPPLSPLQQVWLADRHAEGRRVGVIIGTPNGGIWLPGIQWQGAMSAAECTSALRPKSAVADLITSLTLTKPTPPAAPKASARRRTPF